MTEETIQAPVQQDNSGQQGSGTSQAGENWEARYKGQQATLQKFAEEVKTLQAQLVTKNSEIEQLRVQLAQKDGEVTLVAGERDKAKSDMSARIAELERQSSELDALKAKIKVAKNKGAIEILALEHLIPNTTNEAEIERVVEELSGYAKQKMSDHERQLLAGQTTTFGRAASEQKPQTPEAWTALIRTKEQGSKEWKDAMNDYWDFMSTHK